MNFNRHRVLTHGISLAAFSLALTAPADPSGPRIKSPEALPKDFRKTEEGVRRTAPVSTARLHWHRPCKDTLGPHGVLWSPLGGSSRSQNRLAERCCPRSLVSGTSGGVCCWGQDVSEPQVLHVCHGFPSVLRSATQIDSSLFSPSLCKPRSSHNHGAPLPVPSL